MATRFRIGTVNVQHSVHDQFVKLVYDKKLDILCIQEGQKSDINIFLKKLHNSRPNTMYQWSSATKEATWLCNSIISRYPIIERHGCLWEDQFEETRSAIMAKILISSDLVISVMCTHLDHQLETRRLIQLNKFLEFMANISIINNNNNNNNIIDMDQKHNDNNIRKHIEYPDFICGDFNSLLQSDYTTNEWNDIVLIRKNNFWETPVSDLMDNLLCDYYNNKWKYYETLQFALKHKFYKINKNDANIIPNNISFKEFDKKILINKQNNTINNDIINKGNDNNNKIDIKLNEIFLKYFKQHWQHTCRFDTRIDFILMAKHLIKNNKTIKIVDFGFQDTIKSGLTDHKLYWCEFEITSQ